MDPHRFVKSMVKILRKGCYGSPGERWGPSMLPMVVSLPRDGGNGKLQLDFLNGLVREGYFLDWRCCSVRFGF